MSLNLYMVGLIADDVEKSVEFYRRLGVGFPEETGGKPHVEVKMSGDLTFFVNARGRLKELDDARVILEFYLKERAEVDAKYNELVGYGYESFRAPYVASIGMYFALVKDPDGNTVLLSAD
jgi:catechol 2,3-dioxygenase-like lactoylglutathione lyase family enzyme